MFLWMEILTDHIRSVHFYLLLKFDKENAEYFVANQLFTSPLPPLST